MQRITLFAPIALALSASAAAQFTIDDGTLVGIDGSTRQVIEYSTSGAILETLATTMPGAPTGLDVVNGELFANDTTGQVFSINLTTGAATALFAPTGPLENMGSVNGELIMMGWNTSVIERYDTVGNLLGTINLTQIVGTTGIDSDGTDYFLGEWQTGTIYIFDSSGSLLNTLNVGIAANSISGLAYEASSNSLWVATGFGNDMMMQIDLAGNIMQQWPTNSPWINGVDFVGDSGGVNVVCDPANNHTGGTYVKLDNSTLGASGGGMSGLHLDAIDGPAGEFGYFLVSSGASGSLPVSNGILCLDSPAGRYAPAAGASLNSIGSFDGSGVYQSTTQAQQGWDVPSALPSPPGGSIGAGSTWYFQMWFRDGQRSNFSNAIEVSFN
jgi:hypothetical protein